MQQGKFRDSQQVYIYSKFIILMRGRKRNSNLDEEIEEIGGILSGVWSFVAWLTGVIVSLAVGFGLVDGVLTIPYVPDFITHFAGWIVIILSLLGVSLAIIDKLHR